MVMIHWNPGWLGSRFNIIGINIFEKAYGENERGSEGEPGRATHCDAQYSDFASISPKAFRQTSPCYCGSKCRLPRLV